ncbi:exodeoxyribonuclease VII large subunit [Pectinatus sottacetonis]|uniref:exodeoxyribonuclease VII large subunit n=1 Tax=Pectinatus sottacetonis TaxID=1002795 RepID=UPI0018C533EC|nr:exodeoxyribonuclease VII large subunit [Pectinatus sottacetonis]
MPVYNVSEINKYINNLISSDHKLSKVMIRGEISNFKLHSSGHCYLTLKDNTTSIKCVVFHRFAQKLRFKPENGMKIIACGSISVYEKDGVYQLYISQIIPDGIGELNLYYEQLKQKLTQEGLFDDENKKTLPLHVKCIGIITSKTGAVLHDIFTVASHRDPTVKLLLFPVSVQGTASAEQIVNALNFFNTHSDLCDVIIIGRGGGSIEDLWSFNDERVVRAIFSSDIPVVSAVGHETDYTLTDFVSDLRAATPSQAAELCVSSRSELLQKIMLLHSNLCSITNKLLSSHHESLNKYVNHIIFRDPNSLFDDKRQQLDKNIIQFNNLISKHLTDKKNILDILREKIFLLDPIAALKRGYSILYKNTNIIKNVKQLEKNDKVKIILSDGKISAIVDDITEGM